MPFAIGAVVDGVETTFHTPLSGHFSPVFAVVPIGALVISASYEYNYGDYINTCYTHRVFL